MGVDGFKRKLAAILSVDVEGYSRLMDNISDAINFDEFFNKRSFHSTEKDRSKFRPQAIFHSVRLSTGNALPLPLIRQPI